MPFVAAKCPNCGGDIQLDDSLDRGFCMHCGSNISVEKAIQTVRLENAPSLENYYNLSISAIKSQRYRETRDYCNKILEIDGNHWEAIFNKTISVLMLRKREKINLNIAKNGFDQAFNIFVSKNNNTQEIFGFRNDVSYNMLCAIEATYIYAEKHAQSKINKNHSTDDIAQVFYSCLEACDYALSWLTDDMLKDKNIYETRIKLLMAKVDIISLINKPRSYMQMVYDRQEKRHKEEAKWLYMTQNSGELIRQFDKYVSEIQSFNSTYTPPKLLRTTSDYFKHGLKSSVGCFIATEVYGSINTPEVIFLRRFRNDVLYNSVVGRCLIKIYYKISPTISKWLSNKIILKNFLKVLLNIFVKHLANQCSYNHDL